MVYEAGLLSLVRTLLIIVIVYFGVRLIFRYLVPFLLRTFIRKQQSKFNQQFGGGANQSSTEEEGKVKVKSRPNDHQHGSDLGEYVEYEEIDESK